MRNIFDVELRLAAPLKTSKKNFKGMDIRGMNFSRQDLEDTDFSESLCGQSYLGFLSSHVVLLLLASLGSFVMGFGVGGLIYLVFIIKVEIENGFSFDVVAFLGSLLTSIICFIFIRSVFINSLREILFSILVLMFSIAAFFMFSASPEDLWAMILVFSPLGIIFSFSGAVLISLCVSGYLLFLGKAGVLVVLAYMIFPASYGYYVAAFGGSAQVINSDIEKGIALTIFIVASTVIAYFGVSIGRKAFSSSGFYYQSIFRLSQAISSINGTNFHLSNLSGCQFTDAVVTKSNFRKSNLKEVDWGGAKDLDSSCWENTSLDNPIVRKLVRKVNIENIDYRDLDLSGVNLNGADLAGCDFSGADLSGSSLVGSNLTKTKLVRTRLYGSDLSRSCLTGAFIQDWAIATDTIFTNIDCDYVYMRLPTEGNPDAWRKPDNRNEFFEEGDFSDFIAPIVRTLGLYNQPDLDMVKVANTFKTLDLYHHHGIDPSAASIALKQMSTQHPNADMEVVALEGRGDEKIKLQVLVSNKADQSELSQEYFDRYRKISSLSHTDIQSLMASISEKDSRIRSLEEMVTAAVKGDKVYIETQYNMSGEDGVKDEDARKAILLLSANPKDTKRLRLDEEVRELQKSLARAIHRDDFKIEQRWAVTATDVRRSLLDVKPTIVHFSGHGSGGVADGDGMRSIDAEDQDEQSKQTGAEGLIFEDELGSRQLVPAEVLAGLFSLSDQIECVVLNSCYSESQANELIKHIPFVIGMKKEIGDAAAISFSVGFYDALLAGESIEQAFKFGCNSIQLSGIPEHLTPILKIK